MCGRYGRWSRRQRIEELLGIEPSGLDDFTSLYNITPGVNTWIVRAKDGEPATYSYLWGLVPYWSKDPVWCPANQAGASRFESDERSGGNTRSIASRETRGPGGTSTRYAASSSGGRRPTMRAKSAKRIP